MPPGRRVTKARVALTTTPDEATAERIVEALLADGIIACGTILPGARSIYRWRGAVERASESLVILKTRTDRVEELEERLEALHPYDLPELLVLPIEAGLAGYLAWIDDSLSRTNEDG